MARRQLNGNANTQICNPGSTYHDEAYTELWYQAPAQQCTASVIDYDWVTVNRAITKWLNGGN